MHNRCVVAKLEKIMNTNILVDEDGAIQYPVGDYWEQDVRQACYKAAYAALARAEALGARPGWMYSPTSRQEVGLTEEEARLVLDWAEDQI